MRHQLASSASLRLTVTIAGAMALLSIFGLWFQYVQVTRAFDAQQVQTLQADLEGYSALYEQRRIPALRQAMEFRAQTQTGYERIYLLLDKQHAPLAGNIPTWPANVQTSATGFQADPLQRFSYDLPDGTHQTFIGVARDLPGGFPILVAQSLSPRAQLLGEMRSAIMLAALGMVVLSALAGWLVSRLVIGRIDRVNTLADRVAAGELAARIPEPRSDDEFGRLEDHVHHMLDRIEALQAATARLSDNVAHELRTPLNRMRQRLDDLTGPAEVVDALKAELRDTVRVFEALLDIAAAEAATGDMPSLTPVNLSALCQNLFDLYEPIGEERGLKVQARIAPDLWIVGDANLVSRLLANLLDNAMKYTCCGDTVELGLHPNGARHRLSVSDTGPGMPDAPRAHVFEPFQRGTQDGEIPGHGLGLALVRAIATRHGAKLEIVSDQKGFAVLCLWPKVTQA